MDCGLTKASWFAAKSIGRGPWAARQARRWIRQFRTTEELPPNLYGKWNPSVIEDEDFAIAVKEHLWCQGKYAQAQDVLEFFQTPGAREFSYLIDAPPSLRTAQRWMHRMGYTWMKERRGQFADGHERADLVEYRMKHYVPEWMRAELRMRSWDNGKEIPPLLEAGERVVVRWFHDESTFYAHNRRQTRWVHESETAALHKKGEGVSMMVADFVSGDYGWLRRCPPIDSDNKEDNNARVTFRAGKQRDGWFTTQGVSSQLLRAITIVKEQYPDEDHVFIFDNATIHTKVPDNTPIIAKMTLGPSAKVKGEAIGPSGEKTKIDMAPLLFPNGSPQYLYYPDNHLVQSLRGAFKGLAVLLQERGIPGANKLKLVCPARNGCPIGQAVCCARRTMMNQPGLLEQKSVLQLLAELHGCSVTYLPKYHCELNPIEQCWGAAKRVYRDYPNSSLEADLERNMLASLDTVRLESIRKFVTRCRRFVHAYQDGLTGAEAAWANKMYNGHRVVTESVMQLMDDPK
ncbi:hypothetical protein BDV93DRAFT_446005 [Ceratobasidium sp. AG-I]|nr:hypothetical protein BDV93DRAFT_446005 [Ceratobasidium sp. AG-I]